MKDHQIAALVNELTAEIRRLNPNLPAQTRLCISRVVKKHLDKQLSEEYEMTKMVHWAITEGVQVAQYVTWFGTYIGNVRPDGSDGCISYEQTYLTALREARRKLEDADG